MPLAKMFPNELDIDESLVQHLLAMQFPQWSGLSITLVQSAGTDNAIYRLGDDMAVRLPRRPGTEQSLYKEQRWMPFIAPHLPLPIPLHFAIGQPGAGYPYGWSLYRWLEGENAVSSPITDEAQAARAAAQFIAALQGIDSIDGPPPGAHNFNRGEPLANRDAFTRASIASLPAEFDATTLTTMWNVTLQLPVWQNAPVWIHGDLQPGNLLVKDGKLSAVIDFGGLAVGDPACDLMVAWTLLSATGREVFRTLLAVDEATWRRGRGWALSAWAGGVAHYATSHPAFAAMAAHTIREVLADYAQGE